MSAETASEPRRDRLKLVDAAAEPVKAETTEPTVARAPQAEEARPQAAADKAKTGKSPLKRGALMLVSARRSAPGSAAASTGGAMAGFIVSTDDAYVGAEMATISAKLAANIAGVSVVQNQEIKAGRRSSRSMMVTSGSRWTAPGPRAPRRAHAGAHRQPG